MDAPHPFRFAIALLGATSKQEWITKVHKVEDLGYSVLQVPDHLGNQFSPTLALLAAAEASQTLRLGTLVLDINCRHLALLAKEVATLPFSGTPVLLSASPGRRSCLKSPLRECQGA